MKGKAEIEIRNPIASQAHKAEDLRWMSES